MKSKQSKKEKSRGGTHNTATDELGGSGSGGGGEKGMVEKARCPLELCGKVERGSRQGTNKAELKAIRLRGKKKMNKLEAVLPLIRKLEQCTTARNQKKTKKL